MSEDSLEQIILDLKQAQIAYESHQGTYLIGYYKEINERRVANSADKIRSLLASYRQYNNLTPAQVAFAKKLIKNSKHLH